MRHCEIAYGTLYGSSLMEHNQYSCMGAGHKLFADNAHHYVQTWINDSLTTLPTIHCRYVHGRSDVLSLFERIQFHLLQEFGNWKQLERDVTKWK